ncbi:MAG: tetratricopeptide repeat protein [Acutalibacteraceae bacterium]|nr:tetratricopeptide repeat protein [Acutalibacteraceae bacterium]
MKISEIEKMLTNGDCSDELLRQFKTALNRVPASHRCQHCYTTAVGMNLKFSNQAVALIEYGLGFCDSWSDKMLAYYNMAVIYERCSDYENALLCYKQALSAVPIDSSGSPNKAYAPEYAFHMLRVQMLMNGFEYSDDLRYYYELSNQADEFSKSFLNKTFYRKLAEIIILDHDGKTDEMKTAIKKADEMLQPDFAGPLYSLLKRKRYTETTGATKEALKFLKNVKKNS